MTGNLYLIIIFPLWPGKTNVIHFYAWGMWFAATHHHPFNKQWEIHMCRLGGAISEKEVWRERVKMKQIDSILSNNTPQKDREVRILSVINF